MRRQLLSSLLIAASLVLVSCWDERDLIVIAPDGAISVTATVTVGKAEQDAKEKPSPDLINRTVQAFVEDLRAAGWDAERTQAQGEWPFTVVVTAAGNIRRIKSVPHLYTLEEVEPQHRYEVRFIQPIVALMVGSRTVVFQRRWWLPDAQVLAPSGTRVERLVDVNERVPYTIVLK